MKSFSNIPLIADSSADRPAALQRAFTLAKNNQAALTICAVVDAIPTEMQIANSAATPAEFADIACNETHDQLEQIVNFLDEAGVSISTKVLVGRPFIEIIRQVLENGYDLIIKTAEGTAGLKDMLFFLYLPVILLMIRAFAEFASRLQIPRVIGEILAGVLLGPGLLGWIEPVEVIRLAAEIGIILLLTKGERPGATIVA